MDFDTLLRILEAGGPTTVMVVFLAMFIRGDIVSIKTVRQIVDGLATEISTQIIQSLQVEMQEIKERLDNKRESRDLW